MCIFPLIRLFVDNDLCIVHARPKAEYIEEQGPRSPCGGGDSERDCGESENVGDSLDVKHHHRVGSRLADCLFDGNLALAITS